MPPAILLTHTPSMRANYFGDEALAALRALGAVRLHEDERPLDAEGLVEAARGAAIVVADRNTPVPAAVFASLPQLRALSRVAVDIRNVDVAAASGAGVLVTHASPGFVPAVTELVLGFMVDLARGITRASVEYAAGRVPEARRGRQLHGSTLGIIGQGSIGRSLSRLGGALGMTVLACDPHAPPEPPAEAVALDDLLARSHFVVCLAVANADTENLLDARALGLMRPDAVLVNASRGNLVDEDALAAALRQGRIAGAALDVGRAPDQMPSPALAGLPGVLATPHVGGLTAEAISSQALESVRQVAAVLRGQAPPGSVNEAAWTRRPPGA